MSAEAEIMKRARKIFEDAHPGDKRWGNPITGGKAVIQVGVKGEKPKPLSPDERRPYIDQARKELEEDEAS